MPSERDFIRQLQQRFPVRTPVDIGIGDDGAVLDCRKDNQQIVVTDMLLDRTHFDLRHTTPFLIGRKAVAVNLSDLAAMACWPTAAFISVALPRTLESPGQFLTALYDGMEELASRYQFTIAGGDTNSWDGPFAINVCLTGIPATTAPLLRSGAKSGDILIVTGPLGGSLHSGRHLTFEPRLDLAKWLTQSLEVHALMDISDGLSIDLNRMMDSSGTGALVDAEEIPIHDDVAPAVSESSRLQRAMNDGEDFELLAAVASIPESIRWPDGVTISKIGAVMTEQSCQLRSTDGLITPMNEGGWQHLL